MEKRELGLIEDVWLGMEDHGILTCWLMFDFGGTSQGFGGYGLDDYDKDVNGRVGHACGSDFILRILKAVGVDKWEEIRGREMWVEREDTDHNSPIMVIEAPKYRKEGGRFDVRDWQKKWFGKTG